MNIGSSKLMMCECFVTSIKTAKKNVFFVVFLIYRIVRDYIPGGVFPSDLFLVPVLVFLSVSSLETQYGHLPLLRQRYLLGGLCAACSAAFLFLLCPMLPGWDDASGAYLGIFFVSFSCFRKEYWKIILVEVISMSIFLINTISAALAGLTDSHVHMLLGVIRSGLGFANPNGLSINLFYLLALIYMGGFIRSQILMGMLAFGFLVFIWIIPYTRTVCILCVFILLVLFLEWLQQRKKQKSKALRLALRVTDTISLMAFPLVGVLILSLIILFPRQYGVIIAINEKMRGRISLAHDLISRWGISVFGSLFRMERAGATEIEYATMLVRIGLVGIVVFGLFWVWLSVRSLRAGRRRVLYMLALYALYGVAERNMLGDGGNVFMFLALSDLSADLTTCEFEGELQHLIEKKSILASVATCLPVFAMILLMPCLFNRMRTIVQLEPALCVGTFQSARRVLGFLLLFTLAWGFSILIKRLIRKETISYKALVLVGVCGFILLCHLFYGEIIIIERSEVVQDLIDADAPAIETILSAKTGKMYVDPYPELYQKSYPGISQSILYGEDLARKKNATVLTDIMLDGGGTFETQGFHYAPISDSHAVYTNDEKVIIALEEKGYSVSPYFSQRIHVDLEKCANDSYLVYEPAFPGIYIDQTTEEYQSIYPWTNYNAVYWGVYEVTFTCRLLLPEECTMEESCILAVNYAHSEVIAQYVLTPADADEDGNIVVTFPFNGPSRGKVWVSFSAYSGNIRRLIVEDISYVRVG